MAKRTTKPPALAKDGAVNVGSRDNPFVDHPTYPNPTIQEAVIELRFETPSGSTWDGSNPTALYEAIRDRFPSLVPKQDFQVELEINEEGFATQRLVGPSVRWQFKRDDQAHPALITLTANSIALSSLKPYRNWRAFSDEFFEVFSRFDSVVPGCIPDRIGLRYINRMPRSDASQRLSEWLNENEYIPPRVANSSPPPTYRSEVFESEAEKTIIIILLDPTPSEEAPAGHYVFDIDRIREGAITGGLDEIAKAADSLHEGIWQVFSSAQTSRYLNHLKGDSK